MSDSENAQIILASASPRRLELLAQIGVQAIAQAVDIDESRLDDESATTYVSRLALEKAEQGYKQIPNPNSLPVLGSDTVVEFESEILLKPNNRQAAAQMLARLSDQTHRVHTAVAVVNAEQRHCVLNTSRVTFDKLTANDIKCYIETGEPDDKAGSYGIQGLAAQFVKNLEGSYSGVMGLPLFETRQLLLKFGINPLTAARP